MSSGEARWRPSTAEDFATRRSIEALCGSVDQRSFSRAIDPPQRLAPHTLFFALLRLTSFRHEYKYRKHATYQHCGANVAGAHNNDGNQRGRRRRFANARVFLADLGVAGAHEHQRIERQDGILHRALESKVRSQTSSFPASQGWTKMANQLRL